MTHWRVGACCRHWSWPHNSRPANGKAIALSVKDNAKANAMTTKVKAHTAKCSHCSVQCWKLTELDFAVYQLLFFSYWYNKITFCGTRYLSHCCTLRYVMLWRQWRHSLVNRCASLQLPASREKVIFLNCWQCIPTISPLYPSCLETCYHAKWNILLHTVPFY